MAPALFQIVSDLHLETLPTYSHSKLKQTAPYLALLGDIGRAGDSQLFSFLEKQVSRYWAVFFVLGNHESQGSTFAACKARMRVFADRMENLRSGSTVGRFIFLDQMRYDLSDHLTILGCTLFSYIDPSQATAVESRLVDFKAISNWTIQDHSRAHESDREWLNTQVSQISSREPQRQIAIFTHHSPCAHDERASLPEQRASEVSSGFSTDLRAEGCWRNTTTKLWAFGHTHFNCDFMDEETGKRVLTNQKGYSMIPQDAFDASRVYRIGE